MWKFDAKTQWQPLKNGQYPFRLKTRPFGLLDRSNGITYPVYKGESEFFSYGFVRSETQWQPNTN